MKPYGIKLQDRRRMYDYDSDKFNSRGCFNKCKCNKCKQVKHKARINTSRRQKSLNVINCMRSAKKRQRFIFKILIQNEFNSR